MSGAPSVPSLSIQDMIAAVGDRPFALVNLARTLLAHQNDRRGAIDLCRRALALAPEDRKLRAICSEFMSRGVGSWYFTMVQDQERHRLYGEAFRRAIRPGARVLDIGAGTGLFAMMAARAGAGEVIACERDPAVADAARNAVAANGLSHVVRIVEADSLSLQLDEPADVLVWDNLANNLIGVGALDTLDDAKRRLLKPDAALIPFAADVRVALAETGGVGGMGTVEGFDLSAFDDLRRPATKSRSKLERRSCAATIFSFDFRSSGRMGERDGDALVAATGGAVNAIAQWLTFHVHDDIRYDTGEAGVTAFGIEAHPTPRLEPVAGKAVAIAGSHDRDRLWLWLQDR